MFSVFIFGALMNDSEFSAAVDSLQRAIIRAKTEEKEIQSLIEVGIQQDKIYQTIEEEPNEWSADYKRTYGDHAELRKLRKALKTQKFLLEGERFYVSHHGYDQESELRRIEKMRRDRPL